MSDRAAIVTGGSSGIGLAIARMLAREGYGITLAARRPAKLAAAAEEVRSEGGEVKHVAGNLADEEVVKQVVSEHREHFGRLDVLVNNAGVGIGGAIGEMQTRHIDLQLALNVRATMLFCRESVELLRAAGAEHRKALIVNTSSLSGKNGQAWLAAYSASKFAVVGLTQALHRELSEAGVKATVLCPGLVDTPMTDFVKDDVPAAEMISPEDIALQVKCLLEMSPACIVPEIQFVRPGEGPWGG
jgi:NAD(P)-dependent dehydrogenase (short-subunit alcohol dehydrogenase family)